MTLTASLCTVQRINEPVEDRSELASLSEFYICLFYVDPSNSRALCEFCLSRLLSANGHLRVHTVSRPDQILVISAPAMERFRIVQLDNPRKYHVKSFLSHPLSPLPAALLFRMFFCTGIGSIQMVSGPGIPCGRTCAEEAFSYICGQGGRSRWNHSKSGTEGSRPLVDLVYILLPFIRSPLFVLSGVLSGATVNCLGEMPELVWRCSRLLFHTVRLWSKRSQPKHGTR